MLGHLEAHPNIAVRDLDAATRFYRDTLGLRLIGRAGNEAVQLGSGQTTIVLYRSQFAGTNRATTLTWPVVDGIEDLVRRLSDQGVRFEDYEMPNMKREGHLHRSGGMKMAWFKDPEGNILSLVSASANPTAS